MLGSLYRSLHGPDFAGLLARGFISSRPLVASLHNPTRGGEGASSFILNQCLYTVKKRLAIFPFPAGISLNILSLVGNN